MSHENGGWMNDDQRSAVKAEHQSVCQHMKFAAAVSVTRLTKTEDGPATGFMADVTVECNECGKKFCFLGLPTGMLLDGAAVSMDATEARLAILPQGEVRTELEGTPQGFTVRKQPGETTTVSRRCDVCGNSMYHSRLKGYRCPTCD